MGRKDHLITNAENEKKKVRDLKKVTSTAFIGNPPVLTENITASGLVARTTGEVRDTDFPILYDINDQTENLVVDSGTSNLTYTIDLSKQESHYHRLKIADVDENSDTIDSIDIIFENLAANKGLEFTLEFITDENIVTYPTVTFSPPINGVPDEFPDDSTIWYFLVSARTLPDDTTFFQLLNFLTGTSSGVNYPLLYPQDDLGDVSATVDLSWSGSTGQFKKFTLTANTNISFTDSPSSTVLEEMWVLVSQDATGGYSLTATGTNLQNDGILDSLLNKTASEKTLFRFTTGDGGTTIFGEEIDLTAGGSSGFSGFLADLVIDVDKDWNEKIITNLGGLNLYTTTANALTGAGTLQLVSTAAAFRGALASSDTYSADTGIVLFVNSSANISMMAGLGNVVFKYSHNDSTFYFSDDIDLTGNAIVNIDYLESNTDDRPEEGFVRMASTDQIRIRNNVNNDDIVLGQQADSEGHQSFAVIVANGTQLTVSEFDVDFNSNDLINTSDIMPAAGTHQIGDESESYNEIWAQYFKPDVSAGDQTGYQIDSDGMHIINYDSGEDLPGFSVYVDDKPEFSFQTLAGNAHTFSLGSIDEFTSEEEYRIQMGENSNSSARIYFKEGTGNDLILDRAGGGTDQGVQIRVNGLTSARFLSNRISMSDPVQMNSNAITDVLNITADDSGNSTIGETVTNDGGFDYYLNNKIYWDTDEDTYIGMNSGGIDIVSSDSLTIVSAETANMFITESTGINIWVGGNTIATIQDNGLVMQEEIFMFDNKITNLADPTDDQDAATKKYVDENSGGGGSDGGTSIVKEDTDVTASSTDFVDDSELKFTAEANSIYYVIVNVVYSAGTIGDLQMSFSVPASTSFTTASANAQSEFGVFSQTDYSNPKGFTGNTASAFQNGQFVAVFFTGSTAGTINLAFAQTTASSTPTSLFVGSTMRVYQGGTSGGGGSFDRTITDVQMGTQSGDEDSNYVDDAHIIFGNNNFSDDLAIALSTNLPTTATFSYTVTAEDLPTGFEGTDVTEYLAIVSVAGQNLGTGTGSDNVEFTFYLGDDAYNDSGQATVASGNYYTLTVIGEPYVEVGTEIDLRFQTSNSGQNSVLNTVAIWFIPASWNVTAESITVLWTNNNEDVNELVAALPPGFPGTTNESGLGIGTNFQIGGTGGDSTHDNNASSNYPTQNPRMLYGDLVTFKIDDDNSQDSTVLNQLEIPFMHDIGKYRIVTSS